MEWVKKLVVVNSLCAAGLKKLLLSVEASFCLCVLTFVGRGWNMVMPCLPNKRGEVYHAQSCYRWHLSHSVGYLMFALHTSLPICEGFGPPGCKLLAGALWWDEEELCGSCVCIFVCVGVWGSWGLTLQELRASEELCVCFLSHTTSTSPPSLCLILYFVCLYHFFSVFHPLSPFINMLWLVDRQIGNVQ